ncbi:MAG: hypothetical protein IKP66_07185 [Lachnospiraceae bacterium]|nr:hypothetical protein [Lachnospiraceae bacterium]
MKNIKIFTFLCTALLFCLFRFNFYTFAENVNINLNYGINKVAKKGSELPIELSVENRDTQDFKGYLTINVYENNHSVFVYRIDVDISARSTNVYNRTISITNTSNTVIINLYNRKEELVANERTNIDLSFYNENLIIGILSSEYNTLSYLDNLLLTNSTIQTKIVPIDVEKVRNNKNYLDTIDMLVISDYDVASLDYLNDSLYSLVNNGKPIFVGIGKEHGNKSIPSFIHNTDDTKKVDGIESGIQVNKLNFDSSIVVLVSDSFTNFGKLKDADKKFVELLTKCVDEQWIQKLSNSYNSYINNDYYNIGNILNIVDKKKLPDIFIITVLLVFYVAFLTIIIYVFLRNINMREQYGKYAAIFSIIYTIIMVFIGYSVMKKNTFLTYISIVNIKDANTKETAFLNFRTSENGNYSFDTSTNIKLNPILQNNREPIVGYNFMDSKLIKSTIFYEEGDRKIISVENAKDFDSNIFVYENSNYLNDVYNLDCSFQRFDGEITGRITNKMNLTIKNASILLFGKIVQIGDIEPNRSISLSRATNIGAPIGNNLMISDIISDDSNRNIIKYYLDDSILGYYDYGLLFGFIDNNGTIDINSSDVGDVYGRTLLVTKINKEVSLDVADYCLLENAVNTIEGYYDNDTNTINGDMEVVNEYSLEEIKDVSKIYFERIDNYDHGALESYVPFYGEILAFNYATNSYEEIQNNVIDSNMISNYLMPNNHIIIKYNPLSRDPLYRKISLPVPRVIAKK